jgi:hypothetical protein
LKTERWGSPFVEEGSTGEKRTVTRDNNNIIIIMDKSKIADDSAWGKKVTS